MATTTNYGWTTPDDTGLVKDGASAIRSLGTAIDTTTKNLNPSTTLGDLEYRSSTSNTNTRLGIGTTGQVLTVSGGVPAWATPSSGAVVLIQEQTASSSTGITFSSIPATYKQLLLEYNGLYQNAATTGFILRFNNDSGSNYTYKHIRGNLAANTVSGGNTVDTEAASEYAFSYDMNSSAKADQSSGMFLIDNYYSTSKFKTYQFQYYSSTSSTNRYYVGTGIYQSTSAISEINIVRNTGTGTLTNATSTSIRLYGIQ